MTQELRLSVASGSHMLAVNIAALVIAVAMFIYGVSEADRSQGRSGVEFILLAPVLFVGTLISIRGHFTLQPNQSALLMLFGSDAARTIQTGLRWANPFFNKTRDFAATAQLQQREAQGERQARQPDRDRGGGGLEGQRHGARGARHRPLRAVRADPGGSGVRHLANEYSYDHVDDDEGALTLRGGGDEIIAMLKHELQERFDKAGLRVEDARLTHLAYAPEIAGAMLRRQQAEAVIGARKQIVLGAVSMVEMALKGLTERGVVELDAERRAAMVSNLLVVLCAETEVKPIVNAGTLYG